MKKRCKSSDSHNGHYYRELGITVCPQWECDYVAFQKWALSHGYRDDLCIDRRESNGPYSPSNCRWVTVEQQMQNRRKRKVGQSRFKGVAPDKHRWRAFICGGKKRIHIGCFETEEDAARAYDRAARALYGEFARPNFG